MKPLLLLALVTTAIAAERFSNTAADSALSKGEGFAAKLKADTGAADHPAVIFADNFEDGELGARWDEKGSGKTGILSLVPAGAAECGKRCMKVEARLAENHGDGPTKWFEPADTVFVRFYVRFDQNCDYVHHFVTLRANKGQRGGDKWSGFGGAGLKPAGDDRFSTALEPWGDWGKTTSSSPANTSALPAVEGSSPEASDKDWRLMIVDL